MKSFLFATGILLGTLTAEMGGKVVIKCEKTGYSAEIEFKLKVRIIRGSKLGNICIFKLESSICLLDIYT